MPRTSEQNQKVRESRRAEILSSALELFATRGFAATRASDIAEHAGISQGLMYHYFASKEAIFAELVKGAFERLNDACRYCEEMPVPAREKIAMAIEGLLKNLEESRESALYHLLVAQATISDAVPEEVRRVIEEHNRVPYEVMERIIREGQDEGSIKGHDAEELALVFWTSIKGLAIHKAVHGDTVRMPGACVLTGVFW